MSSLVPGELENDNEPKPTLTRGVDTSKAQDLKPHSKDSEEESFSSEDSFERFDKYMQDLEGKIVQKRKEERNGKRKNYQLQRGALIKGERTYKGGLEELTSNDYIKKLVEKLDVIVDKERSYQGGKRQF